MICSIICHDFLLLCFAFIQKSLLYLDEFAVLHETVLSVTDSSLNNNTPDIEKRGTDKTHILILNSKESNMGDISKLDNSRDRQDEVPNFCSNTEGNAAFFIDRKLNEFWPPGKIIQQPAEDLNYKSNNDSNVPLNTEFPVNGLNQNLEGNVHIKQNDLDAISKLTDNSSANIVFTSNILQTERLQQIPDDYSAIPQNVSEMPKQEIPNEIITNVINQQLNISTNIVPEKYENSFSIISLDKNSEKCNGAEKVIEYDAVLEPDDLSKLSNTSEIITSEKNDKDDSKGILIEDITKNGKDESKGFVIEDGKPSNGFNGNSGTVSFESANITTTYDVKSNNNNFNSNFISKIDSSEASNIDDLNFCSTKQNTLESVIHLEAKDQMQNCFKPEAVSEASDLGYFSLDKEPVLSSILEIPEKESVIISENTEIKLSKEILENIKPTEHEQNDCISYGGDNILDDETISKIIHESMQEKNSCLENQNSAEIKEATILKELLTENARNPEVLDEKQSEGIESYQCNDNIKPDLITRSCDLIIQEETEETIPEGTSYVYIILS